MIQHLSVCPIVHEKRAAHISDNPDHIHRCTGDQTILNEIANSH
jgi:hypothetical protein